MNKQSSTSSWIKLATYLLPVVAVFIAGFLIFQQWNRLRSLQEQQTKTVQQLAVLERLAQDWKTQPALRKVAVIPPTPEEQSLFLNMVRGFADTSKVRLVRYTNRPVPPPPTDSAEVQKTGLPPGVMALTSDVEVAGNYNAIRQFLYQLLHAPRLYNTTDLKWNRGINSEKWPTTHLTFTLLRYVVAPLPMRSKKGTVSALPPPTNN